MKGSTALFASILFSASMLNGFAQERPVTSLSEIDWMLGTWSTTDEPLTEGVEGVASKGGMAHMEVTTRYALGRKFVFQDGTLFVNGKQHPAFHSVWGIDPSTSTVRRWVFIEDGLPLEGFVVRDGARVIVRIEREILPVAEEHIQQFGSEKFVGTGDLIFEHINDDEFTVVVDNVKVNGLPIPWPDQGKVIVHRRIEFADSP